MFQPPPLRRSARSAGGNSFANTSSEFPSAISGKHRGARAAARRSAAPAVKPRTPAMSKLSVCILTKDDADTIAGAIASGRFADEVVVVDNGSTDRTVEIATALGARVVHISAIGF